MTQLALTEQAKKALAARAKKAKSSALDAVTARDHAAKAFAYLAPMLQRATASDSPGIGARAATLLADVDHPATPEEAAIVLRAMFQMAGRDGIDRDGPSSHFFHRHGIAFAVRAALAVIGFDARVSGLHPDWAIQVTEKPDQMPSVTIMILDALVPYVRSATVEARAAAVRELEPVFSTQVLMIRNALALLLEEQRWVDAVAAEHEANPQQYDYTRYKLFSVIRTPSVFEAFAKAFPLDLRYGRAKELIARFEELPIETMKAAVLAAFASVDVKAPARGQAWANGDLKGLVELAANIDDADIAAFLAKRGQVKGLVPIITDYFSRLPHRLDVLEAATGERGKVGAAAKTILESAGRRKAAGGATPAAKAKKGKTAKNEQAPWNRVQNAIERPVLALAPPETGHHGLDEPAPHYAVAKYQWATEQTDADQLAQQRARGQIVLGTLTDAAARARFLEAGATAPWHSAADLEGIVARLGPETIPTAITAAIANPKTCAELLLKGSSSRAAVTLASRLDDRELAVPIRAWLHEHAETAAPALLAAAFGTDEAARTHADAGLDMIAALGKRDVVLAAAQALSCEPAARALLDALARDERRDAPGKRPSFAEPAALPTPIVAATGEPLPDVETFLGVLMVARHDRRDRWVEEIRKTCTQESIDAFAWALYGDWVLAGAKAIHEFALFALGHLGSDEIARKLDADIGRLLDKRVTLLHQSLETLALVGTDVALSLLYQRAQTSKFEDTRLRARQILELVAAGRGIAYQDLEDVLVPELGLDEGPILLDYGARTFEVKLDERLEPFLMDEDGKRTKTLPRTKKTDDEKKAKAARARFETLRDDLERLADTQLLRFERAMRDRRAWTRAAFEKEIVHHPLLRFVAPRLVWIDASKRIFRVAEDGTYADDTDAAFQPEGALGVAHPLDVDEAAWKRMTQVFAEYEIVQPFAQLARETFLAARDFEPSATSWDGANGRKATWAAVQALLIGRGWRRTSPDGGTVKRLVRPLGEKARAELTIKPGLTVGPVKAKPEQELGGLVLVGTTLGDLPTLVASELVRDVAVL